MRVEYTEHKTRHKRVQLFDIPDYRLEAVSKVAKAVIVDGLPFSSALARDPEKKIITQSEWEYIKGMMVSRGMAVKINNSHDVTRGGRKFLEGMMV